MPLATRRDLAATGPTEPTAEEVLAATSGPALLRTYAALTHRIHEAEARTRSLSDQMAGAAVGAVSTLRQQRDLVEAEVLRRMGETR